MTDKTYSEGLDRIDLTDLLSDSMGYEDVHKSHLYHYSENSLIRSIPPLDELTYDESYQKNLKTIIDAIKAGSRIAADIQVALVNPYTIIYPTEPNCNLCENSKRLMGTLSHTAELASFYWSLMAMWVNQNLKQISDKEFQDKGLEWDAKDWELGALEYFSEHRSHEEMEDIGFEPDKYDVDWEYANVRGKHEVVGPESAHVSRWRLNEFSEGWENFEANDNDAESALNWFDEHAKELNLLYKTAVHLINYTAYLNVALWQYIPYEEHEELTSEEYLWEQQPRHKTPDCSFFSHGFRYEYFGENVRLAEFDLPDETKQLSDAEGILHNPDPLLISEDPKTVTYPGRKYYMHLIARDIKEADKSEERIKPYLEFFEHLEKDNPYHKWWEIRKKWYEAVRVVRDWYQSQAYRPSNESIKESLWYIHRNSQVANKSTTELQKIKLELLLNRWQETQKDPNDPFDLGGVLEKYDKFSKEFGPILENFGYKLELKKIDEEPAEKEHDVLLFMGGSPSFKDLKLEDDLMKKWRNHNVHSLDHPAFIRKAFIDSLLNSHEKEPGFNEWLMALSDGEGKCSRTDIGYQKSMTKNPSESTYRNAGMRFAEKYELEPVKFYNELTLQSLLRKEFEDHCKTNPKHNKGNLIKLRNYIGRMQGSESIILAFLEACEKMHIDSDTVRVLFDRALPQVGLRKGTSKTLYDARHAALAFHLNEKDLRPKPRRDNALDASLETKAKERDEKIKKYGLLDK